MTDIEMTHAAFTTLDYSDDVLVWGGRKIPNIAQEVGQTPFYAYDSSRIESRVADLRAALPTDMSLHYAMKANPMPAVVHFMSKLVDGLDVASAGELAVALQCNVTAQDISFAGPGKRDTEIAAAIDANITINMESIGEMRRIAAIGTKAGKRPAVAIRVNPQFELKSSGMKMGGRPSAFGVDSEKIPDMLAELAALDLHFCGFHVFSGSQNLRAEAIEESMTRSVDLVIDLVTSCDVELQHVNLGGGLGIPYFPRERPIDLTAACAPAHAAIEKLKQSIGDVEVIMELGRFLVGEAGIYVCKVLDVKDSRGHRFAVTDGGLHHHLAASGNFGQVLRKNYPVVAVERTVEQEEVTIVGPLCTPLDLLGDRITTGRLKPGSLVAVLQSGAYGKTASPEAFLSHPPCAEILV